MQSCTAICGSSLETGVGSELPLTLFDVTHPGLTGQLSKFVCSDNWLHILTSDTELELENFIFQGL